MERELLVAFVAKAIRERLEKAKPDKLGVDATEATLFFLCLIKEACDLLITEQVRAEKE